MGNDRRGKRPCTLGKVRVHQERQAIGSGIGDVLPKAALVASQPSDQIFFPIPLVGVPVLKFVDAVRHRLENTVQHSFAKALRLACRKLIVASALKHQNSRRRQRQGLRGRSSVSGLQECRAELRTEHDEPFEVGRRPLTDQAGAASDVRALTRAVF